MIADPAFLYRLLLEQAATIGCSVWWEVKNRKDRYFLVSQNATGSSFNFYATLN